MVPIATQWFPNALVTKPRSPPAPHSAALLVNTNPTVGFSFCPQGMGLCGGFIQTGAGRALGWLLTELVCRGVGGPQITWHRGWTFFSHPLHGCQCHGLLLLLPPELLPLVGGGSVSGQKPKPLSHIITHPEIPEEQKHRCLPGRPMC